MKYVLLLILLPALITAGCASSRGYEKEQNEKVQYDRVLEGKSEGYRGPIHVQVLMNGGSIMEIVIVDSQEDRFVGGAAIEELIDAVIECNTTDVDVISGATMSSKGFLEAVFNAIMGYE